MASRVCIDATLAIRWLVPTSGDAAAESLLASWDRDGTELIAPPLLETEVVSAIRTLVYFRTLLPQEGEQAFTLYRELGVKLVNPPGLSRVAWELSQKHNLPGTHDMHYLAVAELEDCTLWTANTGLFDTLKGKTGRVRLADSPADRTIRPVRNVETKNTVPDFPGLWRAV